MTWHTMFSRHEFLQGLIIMRTIQTALFSLIIALMFNANASATEVYKWVDERGVVHYAERAPKDKNKNVQVITTKTRPSRAYAVPESGDAEKAKETDTPAPAAKPAAPKVAKKDPATCKKAQADLRLLTSKPIVRQNGKVMTIEDKNKAIQNINEIISVHCP